MMADKDKVTRQLKIARGQLDGILKMVEEDRYCVDISTQILATVAILKRTNQEILHAHIRGCVREGLHTDKPNEKLEEALSLLDKMVQ
ncbi:MAG: metal-sensing transcriptional repressor [Spirochaetes bacterium]|uniref:Copper-sensing transcriptional repressor CsoR n=1 Tax=Candidatus Aphodenecus pullistercoris TaxID=2840669 RepID=A0A9D9E6T7_9SPIR|nr:metal-sensing transcriptional repressor [Candidatus Aphodenecus pullistercoris]